MHPNSLSRLAGLPAGINAYTAVGTARKAAMHSTGRAFLRILARDLGLAAGTFEIRSNQGGVAVSGEVTLHADHLYVQISEFAYGHGGASVLYRTCNGRKDYTGGPNYATTMRRVHADYPAFLCICRMLNCHAEAA
jgi:hypothetical protein